MRAFFGLIWLLTGAVSAQELPPPITDEDYLPVSRAEAELGQLLFYDPILSGNLNIACATCHHPDHGTADGIALAIGEGGIGLGPDRHVNPAQMPEKRIPRNAPALFNLGAREFNVLFHDGRLEQLADRVRTPLGADMAQGFASILSAQTMFPVLSRDEMAGSHRENEIGRAVRQGLITGPDGAWDLIARRVATFPAYAAMFSNVYPDRGAIEFTDISNAIAAFMAFEWRSDTAPFDAMLRGERALQGDAARGLALFYGRAGCSGCHAGPFLTDHRFHAMGAAQIGPGKAETFESHYRDEGRFRVTGRAEDRFAFRTPSLRNVVLTAPYGHAGAEPDLARFVADHADPVAGLARFEADRVALPAFEAAQDFVVMHNPAETAAIAAAVVRTPIALDGEEVRQITAFLASLTDPVAKRGRLGIPDAVPSGLPVAGVEGQVKGISQ